MRDSEQETLRHIRRVQDLLSDVTYRLIKRGIAHDTSKLQEPEASVFDEYTAKLKGVTYGSEEYKQFLAAMQPALKHHYSNNSHHPEHYRWHCPACLGQFSSVEVATGQVLDEGEFYCPDCTRNAPHAPRMTLQDRPSAGIRGMTLLDLIEMLVDWKAASERHDDGSIEKSLEINKTRFGYGPELQAILARTAEELWGWERGNRCGESPAG